MKIIHETETVVIGAGAVGCSIACFLAKQGKAVTVIDAKGIGAGTTSATLGLVWTQGKQPAEYMELNLASSQLHARLAEEFDEDVELRQPGGLVISPDPEEYEKLLQIMHNLNTSSSAYNARELTSSELRELEPYASPDLPGGIYGPNDGFINPIKYVLNVARLGAKQGVTFMLNTPAIRIQKSNEVITGVHTQEGFIKALAVVVAAGTGVTNLVKPLGLNMPLDFVRGEILVTAAFKPIIHHPSRHIIQTVSGNLLLGSTHSKGGLERYTTPASARSLAANAIRSYPILKEIPVIRQYAGIRPMPVDGKPYLGSVKSTPGLYVAVGHSGITLGPIHGKIISDLIVNGKTDIPIEPYEPERFSSEEILPEHTDYI